MSDSSTTVAVPKATKAKTAGKPKAKKASPAFSATRARRASDLLKMAADPTRLQIVRMLKDGEKHVGAICAEIGLGQPAVSHHIALQRHSGIIECKRRGKNNFYSLTTKGQILATAVDAVMAEDARG